MSKSKQQIITELISALIWAHTIDLGGGLYIFLETPIEEWKGRKPIEELAAGNFQGVTNYIRRIEAGDSSF